ncbi:unnamed protein product [Arabidopsis thaliana]|uniref:(thale cress) hypothetical protein n=1 Tax=Arabidopsis thaliana TaxID=3702 RepID=A0A7G2E924_ARATH|nr:unnamed protein product [Arabidopsis thaliana]
MPPFRFRIPFFSSNSPSRISSGTSSPSPPPTPPSRPPFRPAGIAQPSKSETKPKASPSLSRSRSNVAALAASSSASQLPSLGAATPTRLAKQTNQQSGSPSKKLDSLRMEEQKVATKEKPPGETEKIAEENISPVKEKPPIGARPEEHLEQKETEAVQEQGRNTEAARLVVQENKKVLPEGSGKKSAANQGQQKIEEIEKIALQERKKVLHDDGVQKLEADQGQQKSKETEKLALQETKRSLQAVGREDATRSKTTRHMAAASETTRGPRDLPEKKTETQNRIEIPTDDNHQKTKGALTSNLGNPRVTNREGSSSMSRKIKEDIRDGISKLTWGKSNGDDKSVSVYTLTGENKGATMGIGSEKDKKDGEVHIRRGYRSNPDESSNTTATETENPKDDEAEEEASFTAYINGNTQGINNSIVVESSVSENDPGVHMSFKFEILKKEVIYPPENVEEKKPETVTVTKKLKNEPRVRRRCLRGLLAESSESEPDNPLKPRRHGCRTLNKTLYINPPENTVSQNDIIELWESKVESPHPLDLLLALNHAIFVKGDQTYFTVEPYFEVEASQLYPDIKYTSVDE